MKEEVKETKNNQDNKQENIDNTDKTKNTKNKKTTTFIVGIVCAIIVLIEVLASEIFGFSFETNVIIQVMSIILAVLVWLGILKQENLDVEKQNDISSIKNKIVSQIESTIKSIKNKKEDK